MNLNFIDNNLNLQKVKFLLHLVLAKKKFKHLKKNFFVEVANAD